MKIHRWGVLLLALTSCAGLKVMKQPPPAEEKSKSGLSWGGKPVDGGLKVEKVGYWCEAKHGILTFGAFGPTEPEAKANAIGKCQGMYKDGPCEIDSCKKE